MCRVFLLLLFSLYGKMVCAQTGLPSVNSSLDHELISHYLSDTRDAGRKIHELDSLAGDAASQEEATHIYQVGLSLVPYAQNDGEDVALLYAHFAGLLFDCGAADLALEYEKASYSLYKQAVKECNSTSYNMLGTVGSYYLVYGRYDSALVYYTKAIPEAEGTHLNLWVSAAYNNMGMLQMRTGNYQRAQDCYDSAILFLQLPDRILDSSLLASIYDNKAGLAAANHDFQTAMDYYQKNLLLAELRRDTGRRIRTRIGMVEAAIGDGELSSIPAYLDELNNLYGGRKHSTNDSLGLVESYINYYKAKGDYRMALDALEKHRQMSARATQVRLQTLNQVSEALTRSRLYQYGKDIELFQKDLSHERQVNRQRLLIILLGIAATLIFFALLRNFYRTRARDHKREIELQKLNLQLANQETRMRELEQERISRELDYRKKDLADLSLYLGKLKELYEGVTGKLEEMKDKRPDEQQNMLRRLANEMNTHIHSQEKISLLQENVKDINKEFIDKLLSSYPGLTRSEIELCGLIRLNMSNKEIAILKNSSQESVKMSRYRLRKKLGLEPEEDIYRFISNV